MLESNIKIALIKADMKQQELADILKVSKQTLNSWANGRAKPTLEMAFKIAYILNCKVDDLFDYFPEEE